MAVSIHWNLEEAASYLGVTRPEVQRLIDAGFLHFEEIADDRCLAATHVKGWRRGLADGGARGAEYVRALLADGATQHA